VGLLVQGDRTGDPCLLELAKQWIKARCGKPGQVFLAMVHRRDRPVAGVVLFARTSKAAARLSRQFRERTVEKAYLAVVLDRAMHQARLKDQPASGGHGRYHTASSNVLDILGRPGYRTVQQAREPWKAPAEWQDPVACHSGSMDELAERVGQFFTSQGPVTMKGCQLLVDDVYDRTGDAHNRPQFLQVLVLQGVFELQGWSLDQSETDLKPRLPYNRDEPEEREILTDLMTELQGMSKWHKALLAEFLRLLVPNELGRNPDFCDVYEQLATRRELKRGAIDYHFRRHIFPRIAAFLALHELEKRQYGDLIQSLNPDDLCPRKETP